MKQILPYEVNVGDSIMVVQHYANKGSRYFVGKVMTNYDEYITMDCAPEVIIDLHPSVSMPDVVIKRNEGS